MRILITGACGMLGTDLVETLSKEHEVVGVDVKDPGSWILDLGSVEFSKLDITNKKEVMKAVCDARPGVVIHAAAYTYVDGCEKNPDLTYSVNGTGTQNVALACKEYKAVMTYISTDFVFDGEKRKPYLENDKPNPLSIYGKSKLEGEKHISSLLDKYFIVRTSWLFGKYGRSFVNTILELAQEKKELRVVDDQIGSPTYTKDLAHAIKRLFNITHSSSFITHNLFGIYHISNSGSCSWYEYAQEILRVMGYGSRVKGISSEEMNRPARRPKFSVLSNKRFEKVIGHRMRSWKEALRKYLRR